MATTHYSAYTPHTNIPYIPQSKAQQIHAHVHGIFHITKTQGLCSLSCKTSYRQISWSLEAARMDVTMIVSLWNLTGISASLLSMCLSNFIAIGQVKIWISGLQVFPRSCGKTSVCWINRSSGIGIHKGYRSFPLPWVIEPTRSML